MTCAPPGGGTLAADDINNWITVMQASNQSACGQIESLGNNTFRVTVQWNDQRGTGDGVIVGSATQSIATVSRL